MKRTIIFLPNPEAVSEYPETNIQHVCTTYQETKDWIDDITKGVIWTTQTFVLDTQLLFHFDIIIHRKNSYVKFWQLDDGTIRMYSNGHITRREIKMTNNLEKLWRAGEFDD